MHKNHLNIYTRILLRILGKVLTRNKLRGIIYTRGEAMKSFSSRDVIRQLKSDGWYEVGCEGDHHQFKHPTKKGRVTVTHPVKDIPITTLKSIEKQSGVKFK